MSDKRTRLGTLTLVLTCAVAGALLITGPAGAASRGFKIHNNSSHALHLEAVKRVPTYVCASRTHYKMDLEGRPADGTVLHPGHENAFELKYGFSLLGGSGTRQTSGTRSRATAAPWNTRSRCTRQTSPASRSLE